MGFYVDLEMPKDCPMCPFANYDMFNTFCGCDITRGKRWAVKNDRDYAESSTRPDWCPLIEVPEPHGELIDRHEAYLRFGKLAETLEEKNGYEAGAPYAMAALFLNNVEEFPTIIPASQEG